MNKEMYKLILGIVIMYICFVVMYLFLKSQKVKINWQQILYEVLSARIKKKKLVHYYGVDKATFRKWIQYFCLNVFSDLKTYNQSRTLSFAESIMVLSILGLKENHPVLSKKEIISIGEGNYRSLRESVIQFPDFYDLSEDAYTHLRVFPPTISERISKYYL